MKMEGHMAVFSMMPFTLFMLTRWRQNHCSVFATSCLVHAKEICSLQEAHNINVSALEHQKATHVPPLHT